MQREIKGSDICANARVFPAIVESSWGTHRSPPENLCPDARSHAKRAIFVAELLGRVTKFHPSPEHLPSLTHADPSDPSRILV